MRIRCSIRLLWRYYSHRPQYYSQHGEREESRGAQEAAVARCAQLPAHVDKAGSNIKLFMPPKDAILQQYLRKFSKHGKLLDADLRLIMVGEDQAGSSEAHTQLPASHRLLR